MFDWLFVYLFVQINVNACFNTYLGYITAVRLCSVLGVTVFLHRVISGLAILISTDEQLQLNRGCFFSTQAMLPVGFPFSQFNFTQRQSD